MTFNYPRFPDPPEEPEPTPAIICPYCGSDETDLTKVRHNSRGTYHDYECFDCDHEWEVLQPVDDDDIPF